MNSPARSIKPRKCKVKACKAEFLPKSSMQEWCSVECGVVLGLERVAKQERIRAKREQEEFRQRKLAAKPISYWEHKAQRAVNALRRFIDKDKPCYTCDARWTVQWEAGHYRSRGACSSARFDWKRNIRTQCHRCNVELSGNAGMFRKRLAEELGEQAVLDLEAMPKSYRWTRAECEAIEAEAKELLAELKEWEE